MTRTVFHTNEDAACGVRDAVSLMDAHAFKEGNVDKERSLRVKFRAVGDAHLVVTVRNRCTCWQLVKSCANRNIRRLKRVARKRCSQDSQFALGETLSEVLSFKYEFHDW